ncbi:Ig-like domain-containing protein [Deinococcus cellulosilyticus]|uniref:Uncharacterized protein n=1 Tax=Deinococcus cellulosilyticus (strain DSM 18568 / NBRC 106333 / KACC 11606 / 5516J-15) TaxID=1223518 RepID=A0A511MXY5_DEIC1|nr:Ig-like domain-containing protein [Deinococcus cellulosilyticus]GEM45221.1 hypothetical protein DC3_08560 [Deinococcus cellulosilyticus NBRC 106333 = KACC 11606]
MKNLKQLMGPSVALLLAACASTPVPDVVAPSIKINASSTKITSKQTLKITAETSDDRGKVTHVEFYKDGKLVFTDTQAPYEYTEAFETDGVVFSSTYSAKAQDASKNVGLSNAVKVDVNIHDSTAPTVNLVASTTIFTGKGTLKLTATAQDNVGVSKVEFYKDGQKVAEDLTAPFEYTEAFETEGLAGNFSYHARVVDTASNSSNSQTVKVLVNLPDQTPPAEVQLTANSTVFKDKGTLRLTATAQDNLMLSRVEFYKDGKKVAEDLTAPFEYTEAFEIDPLQSNANYIARVYDAHNNATSSQPVKVVVDIPDQTPPTMELQANQTEFTGKGTLKLTVAAQDNVGVSKVEFYKDGLQVAEDLTAPYEYTEAFETEGVKNSFIYHAVAFDAQNLSGSDEPLMVDVNIPDLTDPTITLQANQTTFNEAGQLVLTADAQDNVGVSKVEFYKDGTLVATDPSAPYTLEEWISSEGTFNYTAKVFDTAGRLASSNGVQVTSTVKIEALKGFYDQQIQEWPADAGLTGKVLGEVSSRKDPPSPLSSGAVNAQGKFSLDLPAPASSQLAALGTPTFPAECTSDVKVTDPEVLVATLNTSVLLEGASQPIAIWASTVKQPNLGGTGYIPFYADQDVTFTGTVNCQPPTFYPYEKETYDVHLKKGWNLVAVTYTGPLEVSFTSTTSVPADLKWWLSAPVTPPTSGTSVLTDQQVVDWKPELGTHVRFMFSGTLYGNFSNGTPLVEVPINEQGKFSATLPTPAKDLMQPLALLSTGCTGDFQLGDPGALGGFMNTGLFTPGSSGLRGLAGANTSPFAGMPAVGSNQYIPAFADRKVLLTGTLSCGGSLLTYNVFLNQGWNLLKATLVNTSPFEIALEGLQAVPKDLLWWPAPSSGPQMNSLSSFAKQQGSDKQMLRPNTNHPLFSIKLPF